MTPQEKLIHFMEVKSAHLSSLYERKVFMTPQEKLIRFMEVKSAYLSSLHDKMPNYFTESDKQDILQWSTDDCEKVVDCLKEDIGSFINNHTFFISDVRICPFCVYYLKSCGTQPIKFNGCFDCAWGETHGFCCRNSEYNVTLSILETLGAGSITYALASNASNGKFKELYDILT